MSDLDYAAAGIPVREDIRAAHAWFALHLRSPGTWWTGAERVAIAAESRNAADCPLCRERKAALSPSAVSGEHASPSALPASAVDVIHRVRSDPARLSRSWFESVTGAELAVEAYVEIIGVVTALAGIDFFCRALGVAPLELPEPLAGEPSRYRPEGLKSGIAWVPMLAPEGASGPEADLYRGIDFVPNIMRALSCVPDQVRAWRVFSDPYYVPMEKLGDPTHARELDRMQMELVAARVSSLNECFY
jgi:hypothetical protein